MGGQQPTGVRANAGISTSPADCSLKRHAAKTPRWMKSFDMADILWTARCSCRWWISIVAMDPL